MKTPVCIISFNRALYLDSLLHSLSNENELDVVVVDNGSKESRINQVFDAWSDKIKILSLQGGDWINDEYKAKNTFIEYCKTNKCFTESFLFLQDDMQYVGPKGELGNIINEINKTDFLNVSMTGIRKSVISSIYSQKRIENVWQLKDNHFGTIGLHKKKVFDEVGRYTQNFPTTKEYWGRGEDDYHSRVVTKYGHDSLISGFMHVPVFVSVWNDPRGHYSFLRDNKRFGQYIPPVAPNFTYYKHLTSQQYENLLNKQHPSGYIDIAHPIGWNYAITPDGDQKKYPQQTIMSEGPVSDII